MSYKVIELTQGNIDNDHFYLSSILDFFPDDAVGGANIKNEAEMKLEIHSGIGDPVFTDIAGDKKIFRKRAWVGEFYRAHNLKAGDKVIIEHTEGNRYHVYPARA